MKTILAPNPPAPWQRRAIGFIVFGLLFTGFAQMPLFKRYYHADVPGFAWTADFYATHRMHYALAAILVAWLTYRAFLALAAWRQGWRPPLETAIKGILWVALVGTGLLRVLKNEPDIFFSPTFTMAIDWGHLILPFLLGPVALWASRRSRT